MTKTVVAPAPYVHQDYPKMLYRQGVSRTVKNQLAHFELCNAEAGWTESPAPAAPAAPAAIAPLAPGPIAVDLELQTLRAEVTRLTTELVRAQSDLKLALLDAEVYRAPSQAAAPDADVAAAVVQNVVIEAPKAEPVEMTEDEQERAALYATPVTAIVSKLKGSKREVLEKLQTYELANPTVPGGRKTLLAAVDIAIKGLL